MIALEGITKTFTMKEGQVEAVRNVTLHIAEHEIYGIIGFSGAGKSTLVRCMNLLERPEQGKVKLAGKELTGLSGRELREARKDIGMIFQHFNLFRSRTVFQNIAYPLRGRGRDKEEIRKKVRALLKLVDLEDKENVYPSQLSGGQKQRVAIARALATDPKVLLCDEATSALDPQTTASILELLKDINHRFGITIVIITHQMSVIRKICSHVAIMASGEIKEYGLVDEIFSHPKTKEARDLILKDVEGEGAASLAKPQDRLMDAKKIRIVFSENSSFEPVIANMVLKTGRPVNILRADTKNVGGIAKGEMILGLPDDEKLQKEIEDYICARGLEIEEVTGDV